MKIWQNGFYYRRSASMLFLGKCEITTLQICWINDMDCKKAFTDVFKFLTVEKTKKIQLHCYWWYIVSVYTQTTPTNSRLYNQNTPISDNTSLIDSYKKRQKIRLRPCRAWGLQKPLPFWLLKTCQHNQAKNRFPKQASVLLWILEDLESNQEIHSLAIFLFYAQTKIRFWSLTTGHDNRLFLFAVACSQMFFVNKGIKSP